jgi:hypothetical protein
MALTEKQQVAKDVKEHAKNGAAGAIAIFCAWCVGEKPSEGFCMVMDCPLREFSPYLVGKGAERIGGWKNPHLQYQITALEVVSDRKIEMAQQDAEVAE